MSVGKQFEIFCCFIKEVKAGKRCVILAPDYVVLSQNAYQDLLGNKPGVAKPPEDIELKSGNDYWYEKRIG